VRAAAYSLGRIPAPSFPQPENVRRPVRTMPWAARQRESPQLSARAMSVLRPRNTYETKSSALSSACEDATYFGGLRVGVKPARANPQLSDQLPMRMCARVLRIYKQSVSMCNEERTKIKVLGGGVG